MKVVILAGGRGTRMGEETDMRPKPMIEIGGMPILWHIMKIYSKYGFNDFVICLGYKGYLIKEFFYNYFLHVSDVTIDVAGRSCQVHASDVEPWKITLIHTGDDSGTGGRLKAVRNYIDGDFCFTYGDGVADVDINALVEFHKQSGKLATVTTARMPGRFGIISTNGGLVSSFVEKPVDGGYVSGGFFVLSPKVLDYIGGPRMAWEQEPLETLTREGQLAAFQHDGFWYPMDTVRDKEHLEELWASGLAPWRVW